MLPDIHAVLRSLLYEVGHISPLEVDILFEAPSLERFERLTRPAISVYMFDIRENLDLRDASFPVSRNGSGAQRKMPPRRVDLHYMVSALSTEVDDEFRLLWRALATLMKYRELPEALLPPELRTLQPPLIGRALHDDDGQRLVDLWSALSMPPHPSFSYIVTAPVELDIAVSMPLVLTSTMSVRQKANVELDTFMSIGGVVRAKDGAPVEGATVALVGSARLPSVSDSEGRYRLYSVPAGALEITVKPPDGAEQRFAVQVPSSSYEVTLG